MKDDLYQLSKIIQRLRTTEASDFHAKGFQGLWQYLFIVELIQSYDKFQRTYEQNKRREDERN